MRITNRHLFLSFLFLLFMAPAAVSTAQNSGKSCPLIKIEPRRLPDMHIAREGHSVFFVNNEIVAIGGHTSGNLIMCGGSYQGNYDHDNYKPTASCWLIPLGQTADEGLTATAWVPLTNWRCIVLLALVVLLVAVATVYFLLRRRRTSHHTTAADMTADEGTAEAIENDKVIEETSTETAEEAAEPATGLASEELMNRIRLLMTEEQLFRKSDLRLSDLSVELSVNSRYISDAIKAYANCSFTQFVNNYRIDHAKAMLREDPSKKISEVYVESGFASESSFFRNFKSHTGMTPREWIK